jgi:pimeloyl-ACP methyl ester carboxylesterase
MVRGKITILLHGYGETEHSFHFLKNHLPSSYFIVAIDMPYHGNTLWKEGMNFSVDDLLVIIESIKRKHALMENHFQ